MKLGWTADPSYASPHRWIPTPDHEEDQPVTVINAGFPHYNFNSIFTTPVRSAPLPALWWVLDFVVDITTKYNYPTFFLPDIVCDGSKSHGTNIYQETNTNIQ